MSFNRKNAFHIDIVNPDDPEGTEPIIEMLGLNDEILLIFKTKGIYEVLTAEHLDPENKHPDTRHAYQKLYSVGSSHSYVARMIIQFCDILDTLKILRPSNLNLDEIKNYVWDSTKLLLECESAFFKFFEDTNSLVKKCDDIIEKNKAESHIPTLPVIEGLRDNCFSFFSNAKKFLVSTYGLLEIFHGMPGHGAKFNKSNEWVRRKLGESHPLTLMLGTDETWVRLIAECRNAIEHPDEGLKVSFEGFKLRAGNKFSAPSWSYDLRKLNLGSKEEMPLLEDMDVYLSNLLTLYEELLLLCIQDIPGFRDVFTIVKTPDEKINKDRVVMYHLNFKIDWQKGLQKLSADGGIKGK